MKSKVIKSCDLSANVAAGLFVALNPDKVRYVFDPNTYYLWESVLVTDTEPDKLIYPEGWYYAKGCFRNKHQSTTGLYSEVIMLKSNGDIWANTAKYCTLYDD